MAPSPNRAGAVYLLTVRIHKAERLREFAGLLGQAAGMFGAGYKSCDPYVEVLFNGVRGETQVKRGSPNAEFREEVRVPFLMPSWEDSINVNLYCSMGGMASPEMIGEVTLSVDQLLTRGEMQPTWYNFYYARDEEVPADKNQKDLLASAFAGRLLVSAAAQRTEASQLPKSIVGTIAGSFADPHLSKRVLWVDLYEICFELENPEDKASIEEAYVEVAWSPYKGSVEDGKGAEEILLKSDPVQHRPNEPGARQQHGLNMTFQENGRMAAVEVQTPDAGMCSDLIISVYVKGFTWSGGFARWMFLKTSLGDMLPASGSPWDVRPRWYQMRPVQGTEGCFDAGCIHMSINCGPRDTMPRKRPDLEPIKTARYSFRAVISQAVDLPAEDPEGSSDSIVVVFFGSSQMKTKVFPCCTNPAWNQELVDEVELPEEAHRRPDITVMVMDADPSGPLTPQTQLTPLAQLKYCTKDPQALPRRWEGPPQWFDLQPLPGGEPVDCKILLSFELSPVDDPLPRRSPTPATRECKVEFFVVGVRCQEMEIRDPIILVSWGRREDDPGEPVRKKATRQRFTGSDGRVNVLEKLVLKDLPLAADGVRKEFLEVKLLNARELRQDGSNPDYDPAAFAVVELTPYFPWSKDAQAVAHQASEDAKQGSELASVTPSAQPGTCAQPQRGADPAEASRLRELEIFREFGWDVDSIEQSNARIIECVDFATLDASDVMGCKAESKAIQEQEKELLADLPEVESFLKTFTFPEQEASDDPMERRPDLDSGLEAQLPAEELPYTTVELLGNHNGEPGVVGKLKFCCRVVEKGHKDQREEDEWQSKLKSLKDGFANANDLVIRAYVLSADELCPNSGSKDITSFVRSRISLQSDAFVHADDGVTRTHTLHPKFNTLHTFSHCAFPDEGAMQFSVWEAASGLLGSDMSIGADIIDLEDRWFHPKYQKMVARDEVPIETRGLTDTDSSFCSGHLRMWIDIMHREEAQRRGPADLPSADPVEFQLRLVVWTVTRIEVDGDDCPDIYVTAEHILDNDTPVRDQTDTHHNCDDGKGTFNWRILLNLMVPCNNPRITLRVLQDNWMADEAFAEVNLDLTSDFLIAQRGTIVEIKRDTVRMTSPSNPDEVRGILDMEARLLPMTAALAQPVGAGREQPNEEPFLDPNDPHLLKHRSSFGSGEWFGDITALGGALFKGAMLMTMLYVAGGAVAACLGTAMTIIMALK